jgi:hypothetical protein
MRTGSFLAAVALGCLALGLSGFGASAQTPLTQPRPGASLEAPLAAPPGQINRYSIPAFFSLVNTVPQSFASIRIKNNAVVACNVGVRFQQGQTSTDTCVLSIAIPARQSRRLCSRQPGSTNLEACDAACSGAILPVAGHIFVTSDNNANCTNIGVDAQQFYTTDGTDNALAAMSRLSVIKINEPNRGD